MEAVLPGEGWVWLHMALSDARTPGLIDRMSGLTADARATLTSNDTQASIAHDNDVVHGTLVDFERTFDAETQTIGWLHFAVADGIIVTTRLHPLPHRPGQGRGRAQCPLPAADRSLRHDRRRISGER